MDHPRSTPDELPTIQAVYLSSRVEYYTIDTDRGTYVIAVSDSGDIIDASCWVKGHAEDVPRDEALPLLGAAVAYHENRTEPSDDPGELKEQQDFAQDDQMEPRDPDADA